MPGGKPVGRSFIECTARSTVAAQQRLVDLLGEQALAAEIAQRLVLDAVAGGGDGAQADGAFAKAVRREQQRPHMARLPQRQRAAARADQRSGRCKPKLLELR